MLGFWFAYWLIEIHIVRIYFRLICPRWLSAQPQRRMQIIKADKIVPGQNDYDIDVGTSVPNKLTPEIMQQISINQNRGG